MTIHIADHILYHDEFVLVINKPAGLMVEPDRNNYPNLLDQVKRYLRQQAPAGQEIYAQHIHRLDRPVSGIIVFAVRRDVLKNLSEQFAERRVQKFYQAMTSAMPTVHSGTLTDYLRKEKKKAILYDEQIEFSEKASLEYSVVKMDDGLCRWDIVLHTGKYHQIRAQLAKAGCPIVGDVLYGSTAPFKPDAIALTACRLVFQHPIAGEVLDVRI